LRDQGFFAWFEHEQLSIPRCEPGGLSTDLGTQPAVRRIPQLTDLAKLTRISKEAGFFQVAISGEEVAGFLLAFLPEAEYDNSNFLWFKVRYERFIYIDRQTIYSQEGNNQSKLVSLQIKDLQRRTVWLVSSVRAG
jgi:hypothetical protein